MNSLLSKIFGESVSGFGDAFKKIVGAFKTDPETAAKLKMLIEENEYKFAELDAKLRIAELEAEKATIESVNATMREEAKSEHWAQWLWRPCIGFIFALVIFSNYIILPYLAKYGLKAAEIPDNVWMAMLVILGAASGLRGLAKVEAEKKK